MSCRRLVFDTGPLSSFAVVARLDLLEAICAGHGSWPLSVQRELRAGASALPALAHAHQAGFLGVPEVLERPADILEAELLRARLAGSSTTAARPRRSSWPAAGGVCSSPRTGTHGSWPRPSWARAGWPAQRTCSLAPSGWACCGRKAPGSSTGRCWPPVAGLGPFPTTSAHEPARHGGPRERMNPAGWAG
jgi:hypothetical protein